ncbi:hypothetical protein ACFFSW_21500 [Saccharothrix longispora]|uniref:Excreted virulence factor EspC (Type VII ESX diderm) n=1 Tax=Saccharothrix longispora TaxID=33920 RepID=A0ABU1Q6V4_9PSEU|nr:hypothetical protein [Saccharothrix longispora]MDR6598416.1 hypothetical protein [Saccharothrix longispora]
MADAVMAGIVGMGDAVSGFSAATAAGFRIGGDGGKVLIDAVDDMLSEVVKAIGAADRLSQQPPLGSTPAALVYRPFLATVATDEVQGFIPVLVKFKQDLEQLRSDVEKSMGVYQTTDQDAGSTFTA